MSKKYKLILPILVGVLLVGLITSYLPIRNNNSSYGDTDTDIRSMLIAHYKPGTCYGMPTFTEGEPNITLDKQANGWHYKVEDGQCCDIISHEGVVNGKGRHKSIKENAANASKTAC